MSALIYLTLIFLNVITTFFMYARYIGATRRQVVINVVTNTAAAVLVLYMPTWLLTILNVSMLVSLAYGIWVIRTYDLLLLKKSNVIEEEDYDVDEDADKIPEDVLKAWSEVYNAPQD